MDYANFRGIFLRLNPYLTNEQSSRSMMKGAYAMIYDVLLIIRRDFQT